MTYNKATICSTIAAMLTHEEADVSAYSRARGEHIVRLRLEGMSYAQIGTRFKRSATTMSIVARAFCRRAGHVGLRAWHYKELGKMKKAERLAFHRWNAVWIIPWLDKCGDQRVVKSTLVDWAAHEI